MSPAFRLIPQDLPQGRAIREEVVARGAFWRVIRLIVDPPRNGPRFLVIAPLSGHGPLVLRDLVIGLARLGSVEALLWREPKELPLALGRFGLAETVASLIEAFSHTAQSGPPAYVVGLSQSPLPILAAASLMATGGAKADLPRALILISGLLDPLGPPSRIGLIGAATPSRLLENAFFSRIAGPCPGAGRQIYPGAVQALALGAYALRQIWSGGDVARKMMVDDGQAPLRAGFAETFFQVHDLPAELVTDTLTMIFQHRLLPKGQLVLGGNLVEPAALSGIGLMTVEGERDDVSAPGQTSLAHALCPHMAIKDSLTLPGAGHFDTFHGALFRGMVLPRIALFANRSEALLARQ